MEATANTLEAGVAAAESKVRARPMQYQRFTRLNRALHAFMIVSFIELAMTGMFLKFSYTSWASYLSRMLGGFETSGFIHRLAAVVMFAVFVIHLWDLNRQRKRDHG